MSSPNSIATEVIIKRMYYNKGGKKFHSSTLKWSSPKVLLSPTAWAANVNII